MTTLKVEYERSLRDTRIGGSVTLTLSEDSNWQEGWGELYESLKSQVDVAVGQLPTAAASAARTDAPTEPSTEPPDPTPKVSQEPATFIPNQPVEYTGCRVMFNPNDYPAKGDRPAHVRLRIGNSDQIPVGTPQGKVNAKSSDPEIMALLRQFRQGDNVNVQGYFEAPWISHKKDGSTAEEYDLVVQEITRA